MKYSYRILFYIMIIIQVLSLYPIYISLNSPDLFSLIKSYLSIPDLIGLLAIILLYYHKPVSLLFASYYGYLSLELFGKPWQFYQYIYNFFKYGAIQFAFVYTLATTLFFLSSGTLIYWLYKRFIK